MLWLFDCLIGLCTPVIRRRPRGKAVDETGLSSVLARLENGEEVPEADYTPALSSPVSWIEHRYDCADFRAAKLLKLSFYPAVPTSVQELIRHTLTGFKFWPTEPGRDSMCYHSENHQLAFATVEFLSGQKWPDSLFTGDGRPGCEHREAARSRLLIWFSLRERFGFSEFYSANYLPIDLAMLGLLLQYAEDVEVHAKAALAADRILRDYAETLFENTFSGASGRAYPRNNMNAAYSEPNSEIIIRAVWGEGTGTEYAAHTAWLFTSMLASRDRNGKPFYQVPEDIVRLGKSDGELLIDRTFGLPLARYREEGLLAGDDRSLMMQLGSGAMTNPEVLPQTLGFIRKNRLWRNDFFSWLRYFDAPILRRAGLSRFFNPFPNGMALGEARIRTYRNRYFKLSCAQLYQPGANGAQKTTMAATLPDGVTVFINHPLRKDSPKEQSARFEGDRSPSYFGGYGIAPCAFSFGDTVLMIYRLPLFRRLLAPFRMLPYTHAFFPEELMDECTVEGRFAFARKKDSYIALIGKNEFDFLLFDECYARSAQGRISDTSKRFDLVQRGHRTYWITTLSSADKETYEAFKARVQNTPVSFDGKRLSFGDLDLEYSK